MSKIFGNLKLGGKKLETPFTIRQVETHLVFGPLARYFPVGYLALLSGIITLVWALCSNRTVPIGQYIGGLLNTVIFQIVLLPVILLGMTRRQQAILGWGAVKAALGIGALMMAAIGGLGGLSQGHRDAIPDLFLGLVWIPGIEFIPEITPHQKYVTVARVLLSIPCIYFGVKSGEWH